MDGELGALTVMTIKMYWYGMCEFLHSEGRQSEGYNAQ